MSWNSSARWGDELVSMVGRKPLDCGVSGKRESEHFFSLGNRALVRDRADPTLKIRGCQLSRTVHLPVEEHFASAAIAHGIPEAGTPPVLLHSERDANG